MKAYTDYPFVQLGDKAGFTAPVRQVEVLGYDFNKYCVIKVEGLVTDVKAGYLYVAEGRLGQVGQINPNSLPRMVL